MFILLAIRPVQKALEQCASARLCGGCITGTLPIAKPDMNQVSKNVVNKLKCGTVGKRGEEVLIEVVGFVEAVVERSSVCPVELRRAFQMR